MHHLRIVGALALITAFGTMGSGGGTGCDPSDDTPRETARAQPETLERARRSMIDRHLRERGVAEAVVTAMAKVPREEFVPTDQRAYAYEDRALPIGYGQTISQPYVVAVMTDAVHPRSTDRVLEIGTGSGYQAAVLAELADTVYTVEIIPELTERATETLRRLGYRNVIAATRDGYRGWPEHAPFDVIVVTAAPDHVPQPLVEQLAPGGRMVIPVGGLFQKLTLVEKSLDGRVRTRSILGVRFVPMTGEAGEKGQ